MSKYHHNTSSKPCRRIITEVLQGRCTLRPHLFADNKRRTGDNILQLPTITQHKKHNTCATPDNTTTGKRHRDAGSFPTHKHVRSDPQTAYLFTQIGKERKWQGQTVLDLPISPSPRGSPTWSGSTHTVAQLVVHSSKSEMNK